MAARYPPVWVRGQFPEIGGGVVVSSRAKQIQH